MAVEAELLVFIGGIFITLLLFYLFCCYLPRLPQEDWGYYDRSRIAENQYVTGNAGRETRADYPDQMRATQRMNRIFDNVIEKEVIMSTKPSNSKSHIHIPFTQSIRDWVSRVPSERTSSGNSSLTTSVAKTGGSDGTSIETKNSATTERTRSTGTRATVVTIREDLPENEQINNDDFFVEVTEMSDLKNNIPVKSKRSIRDSLGISILSFRKSIISSVGSIASTISSKSQKSMKLYTTEKCFICLQDYKVGDKINWSPNNKCIHSFHDACMFRWLMLNDECPLCREDYLLNSAEEGRMNEIRKRNESAIE